MTLAERLKLARESLGYTQKDMATALKTNPQTWQVYESGKSVPGGKVFEALAGMGFNMNWLLTGEVEIKEKLYILRQDEYGRINGVPVKKNTQKITATGRMAADSLEFVEKHLKPMLEMQKEVDLEIGRLIRLVNKLNYKNLFKLDDIVVALLNEQDEEENKPETDTEKMLDNTE